MTVFRWFLRDRRRSSAWWALGVLALIVLTMAFYPSIRGEQNLDDVVKDLPPAMQALFGLQDGVSLGSPAGYLQARLFSSLLTILLVVLGIATGAAAVGGSEEDGGLELLLSNPVSRSRVLTERFAALAALLSAHTALVILEIFLFAAVFDALDGVSTTGLLAASAGAGALALLHGSLAFTAGAWTGRRSTAIGIASAAAAGGFLAQGLLVAADAPVAVRSLTPWYWYLHENMLLHGPAVESWLPASALSVVIALVGVAGFHRRDLR